MNLVKALYRSPFSPVLLSSTPLAVSDEQKGYVKSILEVSCSDSKFAQKAYDAIVYVLTASPTKVPTISSLTPNSAEVGDPSFTLHVHGTNFTSLSKIVFNGSEEVTTFVGPTELTTQVDMSTVSGPVSVPVHVLSAEGVLSSPSTFSFTDGTPLALKSKEPVKEVVQKK